MGNPTLKIKSIKNVPHDVLRIDVKKQEEFNFLPDQTINIAINKSNFRKEERPFTFSNLPTNNSLEYTIKTYPDQKGVFIAGGAGNTSFISIFRNMKAKNQIGYHMLLVANKTKATIFLENEMEVSHY